MPKFRAGIFSPSINRSSLSAKIGAINDVTEARKSRLGSLETLLVLEKDIMPCWWGTRLLLMLTRTSLEANNTKLNPIKRAKLPHLCRTHNTMEEMARDGKGVRCLICVNDDACSLRLYEKEESHHA